MTGKREGNVEDRLMQTGKDYNKKLKNKKKNEA
jgi:hypothetical protein